MKNAYNTSVWKPEKKGPLGRYNQRQEEIINIDIKETECEGADQIQLALDRVKYKLSWTWQQILGSINSREFLDQHRGLSELYSMELITEAI